MLEIDLLVQRFVLEIFECPVEVTPRIIVVVFFLVLSLLLTAC